MLGAEQEIIANEVAAGRVKLVYWPMLDLGPNSENAAATAFCAGEQDPALFWEAHHTLFRNQMHLYLARRDYFMETAAGWGLDTVAFEACYDGDETRALLEQLDTARREAGVTQRPTFDVNGQRLLGAQPYEAFAGLIASQLP